MLVPYGRRRDQVGELSLPAGDGPHPVVVLLHGGFWRARYDRRLMEPLAADLARRGFAAWNLGYRRPRPPLRSGWPQTFLDVGAGIDHLAAVARSGVPLQLARVAAVGHSAGGQLALWAAARPRLPDGAPGAGPVVAVSHAVAQAGVVDLVDAFRRKLGAGAVRRFLGGAPARVAERYAIASPVEHLPLRVPQLLVHGALDDTVPADMSRSYAERARAAGDDVSLAVIEDAGHYEHLDPSSAAWHAALLWLERLR